MENITIENLYDLTETIAAELFTEAEYPWEVLPRIHDFILELGKRLPEEIYEKRGEDIWVAKNAKVAPTACLNGPLIIDEEAEIRHCAFVRGNAIVGKGAVDPGTDAYPDGRDDLRCGIGFHKTAFESGIDSQLGKRTYHGGRRCHHTG